MASSGHARGRAGNLGDNVKVSRDKSKVTVTSDSQMSKRCDPRYMHCSMAPLP